MKRIAQIVFLILVSTLAGCTSSILLVAGVPEEDDSHTKENQCIELTKVDGRTDKLYLHPRECRGVPNTINDGPWLASRVADKNYVLLVGMSSEPGKDEIHVATITVIEENDIGLPTSLKLKIGPHYDDAGLTTDPGHGQTTWHFHP